MLNLTIQIKFLHNFNPEELVFKTLWGFFFLNGHFAIYVSSLLIKIFTDVYYVESHCSRSILKNSILPHSFQVGILGVFKHNFKQSVQLIYPLNLFEEGLFVKQDFFLPKFSQQLMPLGDKMSGYVTSEKTPNADCQQKHKSVLQSLKKTLSKNILCRSYNLTVKLNCNFDSNSFFQLKSV